ncbi:unnamed protein product [Pedinophyceae sp. YPF-701]|nr:unnamed protein product [Pedinophyceae sp. YPF-701]
MAVGAEDAAGALELVRKMKVDELKQCLAQVGARRTGIKKQLQERLTDILSSSADAYNRSRAIQAVFTVAASSMSVSVRRAAVAASFRSGAAAAPQASQQSASRPNVRCICEATAQDPVRGALIQCQNQECKIYQHRTCVLVQPGGGQHFLCERCRVQEADPFWVVERVVAAGLPRPVQTSIMDIAEPRTQVLRRFSLSQPECSRLWRDTDTYQLQISCVLMGDAPQERLHWPTQAELAINGARYRPFSRAQNVELSKTSRDLPANVSSMVSPGTNEILLSHRDLRKFYLVARLCRVRPTREVEARIAAPESIADGTQRLIDKARKISDSDDDLVVNQELRLSLIDPMTCARVTRPAYSKQCGAHRVFDLDVFLDAAKRTRKWICPHCLKVTRLQDIVLDSYMARVLDVLENCPSVEEIEVNDAGQWRPVGIEAQGWRSIDNEQRIAPSVVAHAEMMQVESDDDDDKDAKPGPSGGSGARRGVNNKAPPPVIILIDSDDDEPPPAAGTANGNAHAASQPSEQATGASRNGQGGAAPAPATAPASNTGGGARSAAAPQGARTAPPSTAQRPGGPGPPGGAQKNTPGPTPPPAACTSEVRPGARRVPPLRRSATSAPAAGRWTSGCRLRRRRSGVSHARWAALQLLRRAPTATRARQAAAGATVLRGRGHSRAGAARPCTRWRRPGEKATPCWTDTWSCPSSSQRTGIPVSRATRTRWTCRRGRASTACRTTTCSRREHHHYSGRRITA